MLFSNNASKGKAVPIETLFMDWKDNVTYQYTMSKLISPNQGIISLSDYGLIYYLIARNYDISLIIHMMNSYQVVTNTE